MPENRFTRKGYLDIPDGVRGALTAIRPIVTIENIIYETLSRGENPACLSN